MTERRIGGAVAGAASAVLCLLLAAGAGAEGEPMVSKADRAWDQLVNGGKWGKISLDTRLRLEVARVEPAETAQAVTWRTRLGYGTPVWRGFSGFAEGEAVLPVDRHTYHDGIGKTRGKSLIADPPVFQLNRLFAKFEAPETRTELVGGRRRIILDDARFIGNVGWRQNEQTFDSATFATGLGVDKLSLFYGYVWDVRRIFGDKKTGPPATKDFDVDAHLLNASYAFCPEADVVLFAYFLDFEDPVAEVFSSNSYGGRVAGSHPLGDDLHVAYVFSYAFQTEAGEQRNYGAHYVLADASLGLAPVGALGGGYELLGSDDGKARFVTPLATLHAWNGWADAFLDNGGVNGLQDLYLYAAPKLPLGLKGKFVLHNFWSHEHGTYLAIEYDGVLSKAVNSYLTILTKGAYFEARRGEAPADRWRVWLEATFKF